MRLDVCVLVHGKNAIYGHEHVNSLKLNHAPGPLHTIHKPEDGQNETSHFPPPHLGDLSAWWSVAETPRTGKEM